MTNRNRVRLSKLALGLSIALATAPAFAQNTSSGLGGLVTDGSGKPVAGADVTITHVDSGTTSHVTTDANGRYTARGLRVGGPYTITVNKDGVGSDTEKNVFLSLNQVNAVDAHLAAAGAAAPTSLSAVVVTGAQSVFTPDNKSVGTSVDGRQLEIAASANRSLDDIARLDPRITVTDQSDGSISVSGLNNRYNNISVDGLSVTDPFGLNANGLGFTGSPISPDTIAAYDIAITDFDVTTDAVGANINAVTKSGTNDFHGSVYYAYTDGGSMVGDRENSAFSVFDKNKTAGFTFGGPIMKDKLFFYLGYEDQKISGIAGVGADATTTGLLTQAPVDAGAAAFAATGIENGSGGGHVTLENKRTLAKLDWNITDTQRASFTYQKTEETRPTPYSGYVKDWSVILPANWYTSASKTDNYSAQLFSDWSENFTTEFKIGYQKYDNVNGAALDQPEVFACFSPTPCSNNPANIPSTTPWIVSGEDRFRHENSIGSKRWTGHLAGTYYLGDHEIKGGVDFLSNETVDVFGQLLHGSYGFYDKNNNGTPADEIAAGNYGTFVKNYLPTGVTLADAGGTWKYTQWSPFIQDTWQVNDALSIVYGLRYNIPGADHAPPVAVFAPTNPPPCMTPADPGWETRFGYPSNTKIDSDNAIIEPRFAFNYQFPWERRAQLRGGVGLFQTQPPTVWLSNPYLNNGYVSSKQYTSTNPILDPFNPDPLDQPGPTAIAPGICSTTATCQIDVLDPDFKLPSAWKWSGAFDIDLPWGMVGSAEFTYIKMKDAILYLLPNVGVPNGHLPDGRNSYWKTFPTPGAGIGTGTNNGAFPEINTRSTLLTNTNKGATETLVLSLAKTPVNGFSGDASVIFTHSTEVNPGSSSQAYSNYNFVPRVNPNEIVEAPSRFNIPLALKLSMTYEHAWFGDNRTSFTMYYNGHDGNPYSWVFGGDVNGDAVATDVDLAYIPLENDPIVTYKAGTTADQIAAFNHLIDSDPYLSPHRGEIAQPNQQNQPWVNQFDIGIQQELPGFFDDNKFVVRMDVFNFLNFLNSDWGDQRGLGFFGTRRLANISDVTGGKYVYDLGTPANPSWTNFTVRDSSSNPGRVISRWQALLTIKYEF